MTHRFLWYIYVTLIVTLLFIIGEVASDIYSDYHQNIQVPDESLQCQPIALQECQGLGYSHTAMPNLMGLKITGEAEYSLNSFSPLLRYGCSSQLQLLLCSVYAPMCVPNVPVLIGPCAPLCETVQKRCEPIMQDFGFPWPKQLNCSRFPTRNDHINMCMEGPGESVPLPIIPPPPNLMQSIPNRCAPYAHSQLYAYQNSSGICSPICGANVAFSAADKSFTGVWMSLWASVTFVMTLFVALSFALDAANFRYPERAAVHMCMCYALVSGGYLVRLVVGASSVSCVKQEDVVLPVLVTSGSLHAHCALVFTLLYYFSNVAAVWWLMLCVCWLLRACRGSTHEEVLRQSYWLHAFAWCLPAALAITCLLLRRVDADELTGTCYVGNHDSSTLVTWVLIPQFVYLIVGFSLVLVTLACMFATRRRLKQRDVPTTRLDVAAARIAILSVLYMVPATSMIMTYFYELSYRPSWMLNENSRPSIELFLLKIFMSLATGLLSGLFLINARIIRSWQQFYRRLMSSKKPVSIYHGPELVRVTKPKSDCFQHCQHYHHYQYNPKHYRSRGDETNL